MATKKKKELLRGVARGRREHLHPGKPTTLVEMVRADFGDEWAATRKEHAKLNFEGHAFWEFMDFHG